MKKFALLAFLFIGCSQPINYNDTKVISDFMSRLPPNSKNMKHIGGGWYTFDCELEKERKFMVTFCQQYAGDGCSVDFPIITELSK